MPALIVRDGPSAGQRLEIEGELLLGREASDFLKHDGEVSRRHAAVRPAADGLEVEDLGSSNGTFVNDERVSGMRALRSGDVVRVGQTSFDVDLPQAVIAPTATTISEPAGATAVAASPEATAPGPPTAPGPGPVPAAAAPAPAYGAAAPPAYQATPPGYAPGYPAGRRQGSRTAGVLLLVAGLLGLVYAGLVIFTYLDQIEAEEEATSFLIAAGYTVTGDPAGAFKMLLYASIAMLVAHLVQTIGGALLAARRPSGKVFGVLGSVGVLFAWASTLLIVFSNDGSLKPLDWIALALLLGLSIVGSIVALAGGRRAAYG